jgi:hypothetical protein
MDIEKNVELSRDSLRLIAGERLQLGLCRAFLYEVFSHLGPMDPLRARCDLLLENTTTSSLHEKLGIPNAESGVDWDQYLTPDEIERIKLGQ